MTALNYRVIDVDNHYYEPLDSFTRHLDKKFKRRASRCSATASAPGR
ncbi:hypothetical protein B0172_00154 [Mycobacterium avium subsp. paratuberculosis]|nr:hypothetical protein B0172_00154 [Mycobacterium avium subsp. paratuberculosis]